jgi:hypothetical protein
LHVIKQHDERAPGGEGGQHTRQTAQQTHLRRITLGHATSNQSRTANDDRNVVEETLAHLQNVCRVATTQVTLQRLGPHTKRRRLPQRMGTGAQSQSPLAVAGEELDRQPGLAYPDVSE